ncbi:MAG: DUF1697 domain-containing protein [Holophagaceae bacterium]|nr:DUF1697 domain-containing protein [Holophagaceae bacterium]
MISRHLALLRGINVGGKHKLPMKELVAIFEAAGAKDVRTLIQSGNVVFAADAKLAKRIPGLVEAEIQERFGFPAPVVLCSAAEVAVAMDRSPFRSKGISEDALHLMFLKDAPDTAKAKALGTSPFPPDGFVLQGRTIHLHLPNGVADTKLTNAWFDSRLNTVCTGRNWRTMTKLRALLEGQA